MSFAYKASFWECGLVSNLILKCMVLRWTSLENLAVLKTKKAKSGHTLRLHSGTRQQQQQLFQLHTGGICRLLCQKRFTL